MEGREIIVIDADDSDKMDIDEVEEIKAVDSGGQRDAKNNTPSGKFLVSLVRSILSNTSPDLLAEFVASVPPSRRVRYSLYESDPQFPNGKLKSTSFHSVRSLMAKLTEAGVNDDLRTVQRITDLLKDRRRIPTKLLQFCESRRPAYYGQSITFDLFYSFADRWYRYMDKVFNISRPTHTIC